MRLHKTTVPGGRRGPRSWKTMEHLFWLILIQWTHNVADTVAVEQSDGAKQRAGGSGAGEGAVVGQGWGSGAAGVGRGIWNVGPECHNEVTQLH